MVKNLIRGIFTPAVKLLGRLWYWQKFVLLTILFTIPIGFTIYSYVHQLNKSIAFTEKKIVGIQYIAPVITFLKHAQQHRGASVLRARGDESFQTFLDAKELEMLSDIARVDAADNISGAAFRSTNAWAAVKGKWLVLHAEYTILSSAENLAHHTELISDIIDLIHDIGDESNLILDSELSSYETMNAIINILPALTETIGQARAFGLGVADPNNISDNERREFITYAKIARIENAKLQNDMREAFEQDPDLQTEFERPLAEAESAIVSFIELTDKVVDLKKIPMSFPDYNTYMTRIIDAQFRLVERQIGALTRLLETRAAALAAEERIVIAITVASYLLILYFFIGFYLLVARTVREFNDIAEQLISGETAKVSMRSNDELVEAGKAFNTIGQQLIVSNQKISEKIREIEKKSGEIETMNKFMVGRELRMAELKKELQEARAESEKLKGSAAG